MRQKIQTQQMDIVKFEKAGDKHEGIYSGERTLNADYAPLYIVGDKLVAKKKQLEDAFARIALGTYVYIEFQGKVNIKGGKTVNNFLVEIDTDKSNASAGSAPSPDADDDDEVPF